MASRQGGFPPPCGRLCETVIAFLVPRSFLRPHAINQLDRRFHRLHQEVSSRGHPPVLATVFQIWAKGAKLREPIEPHHKHLDFEFLSRNRPDEAADIVIRRIGVNAGKILDPSEVTRPDTVHWIRCRAGRCRKSPHEVSGDRLDEFEIH
jgi:hypothetical protein